MWREPGVWQWQSCSIRDGTGAGRCPPLGLASSWTLVPPAPVLARLWRESSRSLAVPSPLTWPTPLRQAALQGFHYGLRLGELQLAGGPLPDTAPQLHGWGDIKGIIRPGVPGSRRRPPSPALTAAVLLHQGHLEAVPARRPGVDVHGEVGHGPAQGLAHRRRVAPEHASALAVGTRRSATRGAPEDLPPPPGTSAAHQCSMTTRGPTSPGLPSSWAWARARFCGAPAGSGASAAAGCWAPRFLPRGAILGEPRRWGLRRSRMGVPGMPLWGEKGSQVPRRQGSERRVPAGTLL